MITVVIIGHNEGKSVIPMYNALKEYPFQRIWVVDRSSDDTVQQLERLGEGYVKTPMSLIGRQTSYCRNLGARVANPGNDVLFLDGDRIPMKGDLSILSSVTDDVTLLPLEKDPRDMCYNWKRQCYGEVSNMFFSCGVLIKNQAIKKLQEFQNGQIFDESIQNVWGVEDLLLGDICFHLGLTADINFNIRLKGEFSKLEYDDFIPVRLRFQKRDSLNVKW